MVIVAGHLVVDPDNRDSYLAECVGVVEMARSTPGCLDYSISADLIDPERIAIFERWASRPALEVFRESGPGEGQLSAIRSASVADYDVKPSEVA